MVLAIHLGVSSNGIFSIGVCLAAKALVRSLTLGLGLLALLVTKSVNLVLLRKALDRLRPAFLVLLDAHAAGRRGYQTLQALRNKRPVNGQGRMSRGLPRSKPVIVMRLTLEMGEGGKSPMPANQ